MFLKAKKIFYFFIIFFNILFFVSPVFAADCPQGNVAIIGDSLAVGIGGELKKKCPNLSVFATVGISTDKILNDKFNGNVKGKGYNTVMVMGGYNDAHGNIPSATTLNNLKSIYSQAKEENMTVVALTVPSLKNGHPEIVTQINSGINSSGVNILDSASMWATSGNVHDTSSYVRVANEIINKNYAPGTGTGQSQVPVSDGTGTTPTIDTTATAPTYEPNPSSLISGSTACEIWKNAFNLGISFIGVAALAGIIWGGFGYITSYGNQEKITSAKETIWGSVAGMFIGLFAYVLFSLINPYVLQCKIEAPFKLSVNTSGTTQGTGDGTTPVDSSVYANAKKCSAQLQASSSLDPYFIEFGNKYGIDPHYLKAVAQIESGGGKAGSNLSGGRFGDGTSASGAGGPMQFMPSTAASYVPSSAPSSCRTNAGASSPFNASTATGYCRSTVGKYNANCCTPCSMVPNDKSCIPYKDKIPEMQVCERYARTCLQWMWTDQKGQVEMAAKYLASLYKSRGDYMKAACGYNGEKVVSGVCSYGNKVMSQFNSFCKASGGTLEQ